MFRPPPISTLFPYTTLFRSILTDPARLQSLYPNTDLTALNAAVSAFARQVNGAVVDLDSRDRKSTRLNSSHPSISYAVFCLKIKKQTDVAGPDFAGGKNCSR